MVPCQAFHPATLSSSKTSHSYSHIHRPSTTLFLEKGWLDSNNEDDSDGLVTREDLNREMLGMEPKVKRKNGKGKGYKPLDNRDHLPFSVRKKSPDDPYKTAYQKQKERELKTNSTKSKTTDLDRHMLATTKRGRSNSKKQDDSTTPSRLVQRRSKKKKNSDDDDESITTVLGEFELDKSTTSGDVIVLGDREYRVETARCQYKYAGGKRFVMVRKILEVKELTRIQTEEALLRQYNSSPSSSSSTSILSDDDLE